MVVEGEELQVKALDQWTRDLPSDAPRGEILDRNGEILAGTSTRYNIYVRPNSVENKEELATVIASVLGFDKNKVLEKISKRVSEVTIATKVTKEDMSLLFESGVKGIYYSVDNFRYYPNGDFMTQVLGFTGADGNGQTGLESYYDKYLTGVNGSIITETDLIGRELEGGKSYYLPSISGLNVQTTLDARIQRIVEGVVEKAVALYDPKAVACLVMDYTNGEIISLAEYPSFDLNNVPRNDLEKLFSSSKSMLVSSVYEPGSTFKILTAASALDLGVMSTSNRFYCSGSRVVDGKIISEMNVSEKDREECIKKLNERLESKKGLREGTGIHGDVGSRTVYRKVNDYKIKKKALELSGKGGIGEDDNNNNDNNII